MLNVLFVCFIVQLAAIIVIVDGGRINRPRQYQGFYNRPESPYQQQLHQQQPTNDGSQKWFYSSNQQPAAYSWYWTNNDVPSSNFYKNTLPANEADQLSNWACGRSQITNRFSRIMGGQDAVPYSYPWMVSLAKRSLNNLHLCGGVLLTRRHVLTAAHCIEDFDGARDLGVFAGIYYSVGNTNPASTLAITVHPQYDPETFANDLAIVTLTTSLPENDPRIGTICLPPDDSNNEYPPPKSSGVAIGWGSTSFGGRPSTSLKQVALPILEINKWPCNIYATFAQGQICAGELSGGADTCQADSGGPLMLENANSRWEVVGITSFGKSCGKPNTPGIYTRVGDYNPFIRSTIALTRYNPFLTSSSSSSSTFPLDQFLISIILLIAYCLV